jgi:hypothetical protein
MSVEKTVVQGGDRAFETRPYGGRLKVNETMQLVILDPRRSTANGLKSGDVDKEGLRGHPKIAQETVIFLGFFGEKPKDKNQSYALIYRFRHESGQICEVSYSPGASFDSVSKNGTVGYWHVLENRSDVPIMLAVSASPLNNVELRN